jgi:hypothetical protein
MSSDWLAFAVTVAILIVCCIGVLVTSGGDEYFPQVEAIVDDAEAAAQARRERLAREDAWRAARAAEAFEPEGFTAGDRELLRELGIKA